MIEEPWKSRHRLATSDLCPARSRSELSKRALRLMNHADSLWSENRYEELAEAREIEADAWEEAGAFANAETARDQAVRARLGRAGETPFGMPKKEAIDNWERALPSPGLGSEGKKEP